MTARHEPAALFLSYTREDEPLLRKLETHLSLLKRQGLISTWHDRQIIAGSNWAQDIDEHLEQATIILLLVSPDFLASDYCYQIEMQRALEKHQAGQAHTIPIILRPVDWRNTPFAHLQALPTNTKPITTWSNRDEAFADVAVGLRSAIEALSLHTTSVSHATSPAVWNIPYPRNAVFTGRERLLAHLADVLRTRGVVALSQPQIQAISGLGGIVRREVT